MTQKTIKRIMGIDVGTAITGWSILKKDPTANNGMKLVDYGVVTTKAGEQMDSRLDQVYRGIKEVMEQYQPDVVAIESLFYFKNQTTVMTVSQSRGVLLLAANHCSLEIVEYTPLQVKMAVTGYGRADKQQVQKMVKLILGLKEIPKPDDAADAIAIAIAHANSLNFLSKTRSK